MIQSTVIEEKLESIRREWSRPIYRTGDQYSGNYIRYDDAILMIKIIKENGMELEGFETFHLLDDGRVQPDSRLSFEYGSASKADPQKVYDHAINHIKTHAQGGEILYYQIFYDK